MELENRDVDSLADGPIKDVARAGQASDIRGAAFESRVAVDTIQRGNDIDQLGETFILPDDRRVELDMVQTNGDLAEVKRGDFTRASESDVQSLREQIVDNYIGYRDSDSQTVTVVFSDPIEDLDSDIITMLESLDSEYGNIDYRYVSETGN